MFHLVVTHVVVVDSNNFWQEFFAESRQSKDGVFCHLTYTALPCKTQ